MIITTNNVTMTSPPLFITTGARRKYQAEVCWNLSSYVRLENSKVLVLISRNGVKRDEEGDAGNWNCCFCLRQGRLP